MQCLPPRRWFQLRLRTLLVLFLLCAPLGWCANELRRYRRQQVAIDELRRHQVTVVTQATGPDWLCAALGDKAPVRVVSLKHYFSWCGTETLSQPWFGHAQLPLLDELTDVERMQLDGMDMSGTALTHVLRHAKVVELSLADGAVQGICDRLASLTKLRSLDLSRTDVADTDLVPLAKLRGLRILRISDTKLSGAGLHALADADRLEELMISGPVSLAGIEQIGRMAGLRSLCLRSDVAGVDLVDLSKLQNLESLDLSYMKIEGAQLRHVAKLHQLRELFLGDAQLSGNCLAELTGLSSLESLDLEECAIDDEVLRHLPALPRLRKLSLYGNPLSGAALEGLAEKLPELQQLNLRDTPVTDTALQKILDFSKLSDMKLYGTRTTNQALEQVRTKARALGREISLE